MREARSDHAQAGLRVCSGLATAGKPVLGCERLEAGGWREAGAVAVDARVESGEKALHLLQGVARLRRADRKATSLMRRDARRRFYGRCGAAGLGFDRHGAA